jgi:hypothetical protein
MTIQQIVNVFNANLIPSIISFALISYLQGAVSVFQYIIVWTSALSVLTVTIMIFVHWKKGPRCWRNCSEPVMTICLYLNYITLPLCIIGYQTYVTTEHFINHTEHDGDVIQSFLVFYDVMMLMRFTEFFTFIRPKVLEDAKYYCESKARINSLSIAELELELLEAEMQSRLYSKDISKLQALNEALGERLNYLERSKHYGQGQIRIGQYIEVNESIYDLGFVS